jgi:hypothetical protein
MRANSQGDAGVLSEDNKDMLRVWGALFAWALAP